MNINEILQTIEDLHFMREQARGKVKAAEDAVERSFWAAYDDILHIALLRTIEEVEEVCG